MTTQTPAVPAIFQYRNNKVRITQDEHGEPWFVAKDIAEILGYSDTQAMTRRLDPDDCGTCTDNSSGQVRPMSAINESGLYSAILGSIKPEAKQFKKWVTSEVLPSIRKHGAYMTPETIEKAIMNPDFIIRLATELKAEQIKNRILSQELDTHKELRAIYEPKAEALDRISKADGSMCITNAAKILNERPKDLFRILNIRKWIYKRPGSPSWIAYQPRIQIGDMETKTTTIYRSDGTERIIEQALITPKGLTKLATILNKDAEICGQ
jgi:anti-repressor protein